MARIRTVKPELHSSPSLAKVSILARWIFVGLFTLSDDAGRFRYLPRQITGDLFPHDEDVTIPMVVEAIGELVAVDSVRIYQMGEERFGYLPKWEKHQTISKPTPSRIPEPPAESQGNPGDSAESEDSPRASQLEVEVEVEREVEIGNGNFQIASRDHLGRGPVRLGAVIEDLGLAGAR